MLFLILYYYYYITVAMYMVSTFLPLAYSLLQVNPEDLKDVDTSKLSEGGNFTNSFYKNPKFIDELKELLPVLLYQGYLD